MAKFRYTPCKKNDDINLENEQLRGDMINYGDDIDNKRPSTISQIGPTSRRVYHNVDPNRRIEDDLGKILDYESSKAYTNCV